jgi:cytochrome c
MTRTTALTGSILALLTLIWGTYANAADIPSEQVIRPAGSTPYQSNDQADLVAYGEQLWNDKSLSKKGKTACASCHKGNTKMFKKTFLEAYPHPVKMPKKKSGLATVDAEQMVQFCMLAPMKADILPWDSRELAALTAYTVEVVQKQYITAKSK